MEQKIVPWVKVIGILIVGAIVIVAILRDRIVNPPFYQITVNGQGKVEYTPDRAVVNIGVQIDKAATAELALRDLSDKMKKIVDALKKSGLAESDIQTQNYSLFPQYDYTEGLTRLSGYSANQQLNVKVSDLKNKPELVSTVITDATRAGANQINGITYDVSDLEALKQQARLSAIKDARNKTADIAQNLGVRVGKITGWYENPIQAPGVMPLYYGERGGGGAGGGPVPAGAQEIIIEVGITYRIQ